MRAVVASRFSAYSFIDIDRLLMDDLIELYTSALWLAEEEAKAVKGKGKRGR
jgi:hypothetical protein